MFMPTTISQQAFSIPTTRKIASRFFYYLLERGEVKLIRYGLKVRMQICLHKKHSVFDSIGSTLVLHLLNWPKRIIRVYIVDTSKTT